MIYNSQYDCFQPIKISLDTYPSILMYNRTPRNLSLSLTCLNVLQIKQLLEQSSQFSSHLGHFPTWERPLDALSGISPRYLSATSSRLTISSHYRYKLMSNFEFFCKDPSQWRKTFAFHLGALDICPLLKPIPFGLHYLFRTLLPHQPEGLGVQKNSIATLPTY